MERDMWREIQTCPISPTVNTASLVVYMKSCMASNVCGETTSAVLVSTRPATQKEPGINLTSEPEGNDRRLSRETHPAPHCHLRHVYNLPKP